MCYRVARPQGMRCQVAVAGSGSCRGGFPEPSPGAAHQAGRGAQCPTSERLGLVAWSRQVDAIGRYTLRSVSQRLPPNQVPSVLCGYRANADTVLIPGMLLPLAESHGHVAIRSSPLAQGLLPGMYHGPTGL